MLNRSSIQAHPTALVRFKTDLATTTLFWVRSWARWLAIDPWVAASYEAQPPTTVLADAGALGLSNDLLDHYFNQLEGEVVGTNIPLVASTSVFTGEYHADTEVFEPGQYDSLPTSVAQVAEAALKHQHTALWTSGVPRGTVLRRKAPGGQYLYAVHAATASRSTSLFALFQDWSGGDVIELARWTDSDRVPSTSPSLRVFMSFGWPMHKVGPEYAKAPEGAGVSANARWRRAPEHCVLGESYPKLAPAPGTRLQLPSGLWTNGGSLSFGAGSISICAVPWLVDRFAQLGIGDSTLGILRVPYSAQACAIVDEWLTVNNDGPTAVENMTQETLSQKTLHVVPGGWTIKALSRVKDYTCVALTFTGSYSRHLFVKLSDGLWYYAYADSLGSFGMVETTVSGWSAGCQAELCAFDEIDSLTKISNDLSRTKSLVAAYKAEAKGRDKASTSPSSWFVHWDELAAQGVPYDFVTAARSIQTQDYEFEGRAWWMPPPGAVYRLFDHKKRRAYLLVETYPKYPVVQFPEVSARLVVQEENGWQTHRGSLQGVVGVLLGETASLLHLKLALRLTHFDLSAFRSARELYQKVPRKTPKYEACGYSTNDCFARGGRGERYHPVGFQHPVIANACAYPTVEHAYKTYGSSSSLPSWGTKNLLTRVVDGHTEHLFMNKSFVFVYGKLGKLLFKYPISLLDQNEGSYKSFDLADWGLNWIKEPTIHRAETYLSIFPASVHKYMMQSAGVASLNNAYLPANSRLGDVLIQQRKSGNYFGVIDHEGIRVFDPHGEVVTNERYMWWGSSLENRKFRTIWGDNLAHLTYAPVNLPFKEEGVIALDSIPPTYSELRRHLTALQQAHNKPKSFSFLPEYGTLVFKTDSVEYDGSKWAAVTIFAGLWAYSYSLTGALLSSVDLSNAEEAFVFGLSFGVVTPSAPVEDFTNSLGQHVLVFDKKQAPAGLSANIYSQVFAKDYTALAPEGHPKIGHLYKVGDSYVFNNGSRISIYHNDATTAVYLDDVTDVESKLLADYGFSVAVNASREAEVPTIVLHIPDEYPNPDSLRDTGDTLAGSYFHHNVLADNDGDLWLWKQLPNNYHEFVVDAEECGSRLAYMILGNKSVCAQRRKRNGKLGTLQPLLPKGTELVGRDTEASKLTPSQLVQIVQQHPVSWLISDHDTHGNQFMITPDNFVVGLDKGQCFKHANDRERLALDYYPNDDTGQQGPYFYLVYPLISSGHVDRDEALAAIAQTVVRIKFAAESELLEVLKPFVKNRFKEEAEQEAFINRFLNRKRNIDKDFDDFLSKALGAHISLRNYARELKIANIDDIVFRFPSVEVSKVEYETIPAEYQEVTLKTKHDQIAAQLKIKIAPHFTVDYLLAAMHNDKSQLEKFLASTGLKPVGNQESGGFKKTPYGYLVSIHKIAYEKGEKVEVKKEIKTHAKTVVKAVHAKGELPPTMVVAPVEKGKNPVHVVDYVPLEFAFKGKRHNYDDMTIIGQVPKFPRGGANIFLGSPYVVNNYMNLLKVRIKDRFYYEVSMKVDQILLTGLKSSYASKRYQFHARDYLPEKGVYEENSMSKGPLTYANFDAHYKCFEDDTEVWLFNDDTHTKFAMKGTIIVRIPVSRFNTGARMDKVLRNYLDEFKVGGKNVHISSLGELIIPPNDDSLKRITLMKAAFSRLPWSDLSNLDVYSDSAVDQLTKMLEKRKVDVSTLELAYLAEGHASTVHKSSAKKLFSEVKSIRAVTHGGVLGNVSSVLKHGLLSPVERSKRGVTGAGIVNSRDFLTGGAEMIMTMLGHMSSYAARGGSVCYLVSPNQLNRTDLYFHNSDQFGSINPKETSHLVHNPPVFDIIRSADGGWAGSNELIFWHSIPTTALLGVFCQDADEKKQVVEQLKKAQIEAVNGQAVEDFVRDHKNYSVMAEITQKVLEAG